MRLIDLDTNTQFARVDYLVDGKVLFHIPSDMDLPKEVLVSKGGSTGAYMKLVSTKEAEQTDCPWE